MNTSNSNGSALRWAVRFGGAAIAVSAVAVALFFFGSSIIAQSTYQPPKASDGHPDLNGIWQSLDTSADWDVAPHAAAAGPVEALGAEFAVQPGLGIVEGGEIPYLPDALAQKKENYEKRLTDDPEVKCFMPGVPRRLTCPSRSKSCRLPTTS